MNYRIASISDMHNDFPDASELEEVDLIVVAGDITKHGTLEELKTFNRWFGQLLKNWRFDNLDTQAIVIGGNHDGALEKTDKRKLFEEHLKRHTDGRAVYLQHQAMELPNGLKVFGTPFVPLFCKMAFNRETLERQKLWAEIPNDVGLLITHTPAMGILDTVPLPYPNSKGKYEEECGCHLLRSRLDELKALKAHIFGHIHEAGGTEVRVNGQGRHYTAVNACRKMTYGEGSRRPQIFELEV